jgi:predicted PurR-regulated permease PerM
MWNNEMETVGMKRLARRRGSGTGAVRKVLKVRRFVADGNRSSSNTTSTALLTVIIAVAVLYFARTVLIPLALAVLLAFLLAPLVIRLRHWGFGRVPSVLSVVLLTFAILGFIGALLATQLTELGRKLPEYQQNVYQKVESLRSSSSGLINRAGQFIRNLTDEFESAAAGQPATSPDGAKPVPVEVHVSTFSPREAIQKILGSLLNIVLTAGIVIVFVVFILIEREDLRDRLIGLAGVRRVNVTTNLLNEAAQRMSRYLLAQAVVNAAFGILAGLGLYFMHIPNPLLWGVLAALFRYIPYLGIWVAAVMPAAVAFAVEPGYAKGPLILALYFGIDLLMYNFLEPLLYGSSTGISPLAILVAAVFWTWLWGPVGLLLATPLTVCVATIGRYVPNLAFLRVLLTDEPVLPPPMRFYQRMLAMDLEEATETAEEFLKGKSLEDLYDSVIIPALSLAEEDRHRGKLNEERQQFIFQNTRVLVEDIGERAEEIIANGGQNKSRNGTAPRARAAEPPSVANSVVLCMPARDEADEIAALMLAQLLKQRGFDGRALGKAPLAGESLEEVARERPVVACVLAVPPFGYTHVRYLCRRLRSQFGSLRLVGALLTEHDPDELKQRQPPIPANELGSSLKQVMSEILALLPNRIMQLPQETLASA